MSEHELEKLLGGFAADTLTPEEKQRLYGAALQDQQLFNAMADEQALKELLADPAVRRRLLQTLNQTSTSGAGGSLSWLDWFRRPAGLAWAGGLAAGVFAVVLGTRVYQDSLKQAVQSVATEESKPSTPPDSAPTTSQPTSPPVTEPQAKTKENEAPTKSAAKKDAMLDKLAKRERAAAPVPQEQKVSDAVTHTDKDRREQDEVRREADGPVADLGKSVEGVSSSADQKLTASSTPPASPPTSAPMQAPAGVAATGAVAPTVSARALFYGEAAARPDSSVMVQEKERAMQPLAESAPQASKPERKFDQFSQLGRAKGAMTAAKPLGLRYSFIVPGTEGKDREVDAAIATKSGGQLRLTVEANQDAYLQVWKTVGSATPQLLFPDKDSGQISVKILAGQRQQIPLPADSGTVTLTTRLSRVPFGPITRQEAAMFDRHSPHQLQESVSASGVTSSQEQATYVVNQDLSPTTQLSVVIPFGSQ
jgi:hypothetical protein